MELTVAKFILAVITREPTLVGGGAPIFLARSEAEQERIAKYLARITEGVVHDLENGVYVLVKH